MFGVKIREFDDSDGSVESFNKIFPNTPLEGVGKVEILGITQVNNGNVYMRDVSFNDKIFIIEIIITYKFFICIILSYQIYKIIIFIVITNFHNMLHNNLS